MYQEINQTGYSLSLSVECSQLSKFNPNAVYCLVMYSKDEDGVYQEMRSVEAVSGYKEVKFMNLEIRYLFEQSQPLKFDLTVGKCFVGSCQITLGEIVSGAQQTYSLVNLLNKEQGKIKISSQRSRQNAQKITLDILIELNNSLLDQIVQYFRNNQQISIQLITANKLVVHSSEKKYRTEVLRWKGIQSTFEVLCDSDPLQSIYCQVIGHYGNTQQVIGQFEFWKHKIDQQIQLRIMDNDRIVGMATIENFKFDTEGLFYNYIQSGTELALMIAVDFTQSNRSADRADSLHCIGTSNNEYMQAITAVSKILMDYDHDKRVPMYGFGGIPKYMMQYNKHCFPLTGNADECEATSIEQIQQIYEYAVRNVVLDGPTYFNPLIQQAMKLAQLDKEQNGNQYYILLILTDGKYMDEDQTLLSIVDAATLPLSIIIIGIGDCPDLQAMKRLDGNDGLIDGFGRVAQRDLVKFVMFNQFKNDERGLTAEVLDELPAHLVNYKSLIDN